MHKHKWKLIDKTILDSPLTKLLKNGSVKGFKAASGFDRLILTFECECGNVRIEER